MSDNKKMGKVMMFTEVNEPMEEWEFPLPDELEPGAVLVKTSMATVCGSDYHSWRGRRPFPTPSVLGHEGVGTIVKKSPEVERDTAGKDLSVGDRITWTIMANCGNCYFCRIKDLPQKCLNLFKYGHDKSDVFPYFNGTFGEYVYLRPGTGLYKLPEDLADEEASPLMCAASTVTAGLDKVGVEVGDKVVIQGAGMLGLYASVVAKEKGAKQVIMLDKLDGRLEMAKEFGTDVCLNVDSFTEKELINKVKDLTGGFGPDIAVEVTGFAEVIPQGIKMLRIGGRYLIQGSVYPNDTFEVASYDILIKSLTIAGLHNYDSKYLGQAIDIVHKNRDRYPFIKLAGPKFPMTADGVTNAMLSLEKKESIRPIIVPESELE
jgi:putative phosphonate catabolism associated alcohol dehydrogenase